jgi:hypothetical protein
MKNALRLLFLAVALFTSFSLRGAGVNRDTVLVARLEFVVNTSTVVENDVYEHFVGEILPLLRENRENVIKVMVVGSASPEGNKARNRVLETIRSDKAVFYLMNAVDRSKIEVINSSDMFLHVAKREDSDYAARRGVYIEIWLHKPEIYERVDTLRFEKIDTVYSHSTDTIYIEKPWKRIPVLALKTNLVSDLLITPNVQAELYTHVAGLSLEFSYTCPWWHDDGVYFYHQILNGTAGVRKYFKNDYLGHYLGTYVHTGIYDLCYDKRNGWQGETNGAGLGYGYVFASKKHPRLKFEAFIRAGWLYTRYDTYHASEPFDGKYYYNWYKKASDFVPRRFVMNYVGPTMVGFNLTYDLICLRRYY